MGVSMSTLLGWVAVLGLFGGYAFREASRPRQAKLVRDAQRHRPERRDAKEAKPRESKPKEAKPKESKPKRARADESTAKASAPAKPPAARASAAGAAKYSSSSDDDAVSNREFARQLASVKQGTTFAAKTKDESRQKSVKQSRAEETPGAAVAAAASLDGGRSGSAPSSTAGIDADDDRSSAASPVLEATSAVDGMLEKPAPGPSVLRLTGTTDEKRPGTKKPKAVPEPAETKKQRQNRKKMELAKAERDAAEKERQQKLEAQRRLARQAEGRPAQDGSAFLAAQQAKQANNAWTSSGANGKAPSTSSASSGANGVVPVQPLDTFEPNTVQTDASKSSALSYDKNTSEDWMSSLPSEEEQMELLRNEDSWSTVKTKSRKSKSKEAGDEAPPAPSTATNAATPAAPAAAPAAPAALAAPADKKRTPQIAAHSSFAALSVDSQAAEEVEEEWDV